MNDYEKLGVFYLGRHYDLAAKQRTNELLLLDSKSLVTHGMVVGMTGSGKTGLCFDLIEEAAIDGIPAIVIDPKGDLGNLLLTFPELRPADFAPWINEDDARKQGIGGAEYAVQQADLWRKGLAAWEQDGERIRRLRAAAEFAIYTPGSSAGRQISLLQSFTSPPPEIMEDIDFLSERVNSTVAGLLGLVGIEADPVNSRETILLSNLLQRAWGEGRDLDLGSLIQEIQQPSITRLGVLDLETFYPAKERFALAMRLNNLLASPNFATWMKGDPLDIRRLLYTTEGKPRVAIFSIAHLGDSERMFFVTLLLNQVLAWMRAQSGTNSLRALLYMDEIFGYFPPVSNPPSKLPLLTLLKQGRAFGLGVVLATQNPVDLDYKGLANIGTWFIGRLQTERDKARILDGLEGAMTGRGTAFDRQRLDRALGNLGSRVFLLHSVHEEGFEIFESRWAMSYLRGPLSRNQIKALSASIADPSANASPVASAPACAKVVAAGVPQSPASGRATQRPVLPPEVPQYFAPARIGNLEPLIYMPKLLGAAQVRFADVKLRIDETQEIVTITDITDNPVPVDWEEAEELALAVNDLERTPAEGEYTASVPAAGQVKNYDKWSKEFAAWVYGTRRLSLLRCSTAGLVSNADEDPSDFRIRVQQRLREQRDEAADKLRQKYAPKIAVLQERIRRAQATREREASQARRAKMDTVISFGSTLLGAFLGRKAVSASTIGRAAGTMRGAGRVLDQSADVTRAAETVEALEKQFSALDAQFREETAKMTAEFEAQSNELETVEVRPKKTDVRVRLVALVWLPFRGTQGGTTKPAW
jgi:hypothetical protein